MNGAIRAAVSGVNNKMYYHFSILLFDMFFVLVMLTVSDTEASFTANNHIHLKTGDDTIENNLSGKG